VTGGMKIVINCTVGDICGSRNNENDKLQMTKLIGHISFILINGSESMAGGVMVDLSNNGKFYG